MSPQGPSWVQQLCIRPYGMMASMGVDTSGCGGQLQGPGWWPGWLQTCMELWGSKSGSKAGASCGCAGGCRHPACWCVLVTAQSHCGHAAARWGQALRCRAGDSWRVCASGHSGACSDSRWDLILADTPLRGLAAGLPSRAAQCRVRRQWRLLTGIRLAASCNAWLAAAEA